MTRARRSATAAAWLATAAALGLAVAGCSNSSGTHPSASPTGSTSPVASVSPVTPTPAPPTSSVPSTTAAPSTSHASTPPASSSAAPSPLTSSPAPRPPVYTSTCADVTVLALPGGSEPHTQIAGLQFTNQARTSCTLTGFAGVQLLRGSRPVGSPATPAGRVSSIRLAPGGVAESKLEDDVSNCQGASANGIRIQIPGRPETVITDLAVDLRACTLRVRPLGPPD